jgi:hypothetical protein
MWEATSRRACQEALDVAILSFDDSVAAFEATLDIAKSITVLGIYIALEGLPLPVHSEPDDLTALLVEAQNQAIKSFIPLAVGPFFEETKFKLNDILKAKIESVRNEHYTRSINICEVAAKAVVNHLEKLMNSNVFATFDEFAKAQAEAFDAYELATVYIGGARAFVLSKFIPRMEGLREIQRLKFDVSDAQREKDATEKKLLDERLEAERIQRDLIELSRKEKEEHDRVEMALNAQQAELKLRIQQQEEDALAQKKVFDERMETLVRQGKEDLANVEKSMKAETEALLKTERENFDKSVDDMKKRQDELVADLKNRDADIQALQKSLAERVPEVHHHHHSSERGGCVIA